MRQKVLVSLCWLIDSSIISFIFLNINPENSWPLREGAKKVADGLQKYIKANLEKLKTGIWSFGGLFGSFIHTLAGQRDNSDCFLQSLLNEAPADMTVDQLTYNVFGLIVASVANWAMAATHVINFYLDDERAEEKKHIERLAMDRSTQATELLAGYAREALRFDPQAPGIFRDAAQDVVVEEGHGRPPVSIKKGERIFVSLAHANMDVSGRPKTLGIRGECTDIHSKPDVFENPNTIDPCRRREAYYTFGTGEHSCLGNIFTEQVPTIVDPLLIWSLILCHRRFLLSCAPSSPSTMSVVHQVSLGSSTVSVTTSMGRKPGCTCLQRAH